MYSQVNYIRYFSCLSWIVKFLRHTVFPGKVYGRVITLWIGDLTIMRKAWSHVVLKKNMHGVYFYFPAKVNHTYCVYCVIVSCMYTSRRNFWKGAPRVFIKKWVMNFKRLSTRRTLIFRNKISYHFRINVIRGTCNGLLKKIMFRY